MSTLVFLLTILGLFVMIIRLIVKTVRRKTIKPTLKIIISIIICYSLAWLFFYFTSTNIVVKPGTDSCFDDWCATVVNVDKSSQTQKQFSSIAADSCWIVLTLRVSNHARRIAQKPSEPRVNIIDQMGNYWAYSKRGQQLFEKTFGKQPPLDSKLQLHQSIETRLVFSAPPKQKLNVLIEEGPFITKLLFPEDKLIFVVK